MERLESRQPSLSIMAVQQVRPLQHLSVRTITLWLAVPLTLTARAVYACNNAAVKMRFDLLTHVPIT